MTKQQQASKNIDLSGELMDYMIEHKIKARPNHSYVVFVHNDDKLNKMNIKLIKDLVKEGRKIVKAEKTNNPKNPWEFTVIN